MLLTFLLTFLHLLALSVSLPALWRRSRALRNDALRSQPDNSALRHAIGADTVWGLAIGLFLISGVARVYATSDQPPAAYLRDGLFLAKMSLFAAILILELLPMFTFMRWRADLSLDRAPNLKSAPLISRISLLQLLLVILTTLTALAHVLNLTL